ncbi:hypothetical protein [Micromonospora sp. NPDC005220]|uniref:hypothetical protein n=1 Tax=Micromonospora sp. NPDC005220 TaxID=3155589 RepID=UPI0033A9F1AF
MLAAEAPKITDWMQAWGSLAGLLMSGIAAIATLLLLRHEIRVRREEQRDQESAQARLIIARLTGSRREATDPETGVDSGPFVALTWEVINYSSQPIMDAQVGISSSKYPQDDTEGWGDEYVDVIAKKFNGSTELSPPVKVDPLREFQPGNDFDISIEFYDAAGLNWLRKNRETPRRLLPSSWEPSRWTRFKFGFWHKVAALKWKFRKIIWRFWPPDKSDPFWDAPPF